MMQVPLLSYPHFSQFLQMQHQQQVQQHYSRGFLPPELSHRPETSSSDTGTPSPSPSPPLSDNCTLKTAQPCVKAAKSFTIDAILGIREREVDHKVLHPKLSVRLSSGPRYAEDVSVRLPHGREVLGLQLPTDLTINSQVTGSAAIHHGLPAYHPVSPCNRLSAGPEKSPSETTKKCGGKSKRVRTIFTPEQLERLEAEFERQQYMVGPERLYLAHTLQLTEAQVKVWFQNRRIKWRKQHLEIQQQRLAAIKQQQQQQQQQRGEGEESDNESTESGHYGYSDSPGVVYSGEGGGAQEEKHRTLYGTEELEDSPEDCVKHEADG